MYSILIIDDELWIRKGIIKMLNQDKLKISKIYEADDASAAYRLFKDKKPDIVISDVKLPGEDGCTLCERIYEESPNTKLVMISAFRDFEYAKRALSYKAVDYLVKPVDKVKLNELIGVCITEIEKTRSNKKTLLINPDEEINPEGLAAMVEEVKKDIKVNYQYQYSLTELASQYYISESYFSNIFKKHTGISLVNYIMNVRIERGKELLLYTDYQIGDIASMVGYNDQHYFSKIFKRKVGLNPKRYRDKMKRV